MSTHTLPGFGDFSVFPIHTSAEASKLLDSLELAREKILLITYTALTVIAALALSSLISPVGIASATVLSFGVTGTMLPGVIQNRWIYNQFRSEAQDSPLELPIKLEALGKWSKTTNRILPLQDSMQGAEWKKKLIMHANHSIVLSGNYCGGDSFDEILDLISERMKKKPDLKVVILSSPQFVNESNSEKLAELKAKYEKRFMYVQTPSFWHVFPGVKKVTNHTKALVVDYGAYTVMGGSGVEDKYTKARGLGDRGEQKKNSSEKSWVEFFLPRGFRDTDFVIESTNQAGIGARMHLELLKLAHRWNHIAEQNNNQTVLKFLPLVKPAQLKASPPINAFDKDKRVVSGKMKLYATGPEHDENHLNKELVSLVNSATSEIVIDHMYFHPTQTLFNALVRAAVRGVKITIITNGFESKGKGASPMGHRFFGPRNRYNYLALLQGVDEQLQAKSPKRNVRALLKDDSIRIYEFTKHRKTTLHKKLLIIDDKVVLGSSNMGFKSLETNGDHEMNVVVRSSGLVQKLLKRSEIVDADIRVSALNDTIHLKTDSAKGRHKIDVVIRSSELVKKLLGTQAYRRFKLHTLVQELEAICKTPNGNSKVKIETNNIGLKSTPKTGDREKYVEVKLKKLAEKLFERSRTVPGNIEEDRLNSLRIKDPFSKVTYSDTFYALRHRIMAPLVG